MTTPNDQNFDAFPNDDQSTGVVGARTLGSFVVEGHRTDPGGGGDLSTVVYDATAVGVSIGSGKMLGLNYGFIYTADWWQFRSVSAADNFKLASLAIESSSNGWDDVITVSGYNDSGLAVSATVDLTASGSYGSISYVKLGGAVGGTLTFGAGWGNVDTVRFAGQAGDPYGTQLWIDNIDVSPAAAITSAAYNAASGVLTVAASGVSAGESITAAKLTLTGQGGNSYALTSGAVIAGAGTFSITLNAADKLAINGLLNKNLGAADDGTSFNLAGAAGWNSTSGAEVDGTSPVSVSNVTTPSISSATYNAATHVLSVTGANLVGTIGAANDVTVAKLTLTGEGGAAYTLTGASVDVASASAFAVTLSAADRAQVEMMFNRDGTLATDASTAYNLSAADNWNTSFTGGNSAIATASVTVSNVAVPAISSASYDAASGTLVVTGSALTHAAGAANDIVANKVTFTGQGGASYTLTDTANAEITSGTSFTLVLSAADRGAVDLLLNKNGTQSNGGTAYNLAMGEDWAAGAAAAVVVADVSGNTVTVSNVVADTTPPTASLGISDTALSIDDTALVTITFSEAVTGFTNADLTVANGTLGAVSSSDGGVTWNATFTPTAGVTDATNVIVLDKTGVSDAAGNAGVGTASSANYAIDTAAPTAAIVLSDSALAAGESATVTLTFSEAVSGLTLADLSAGAGALSGLSTLDGGVTWSATFTPSAATTSGSNVITLGANSLFDLAGNANAGTTSSANYLVDTQRPTASVTLSDSALKAGETSTVTIAFSEAVSGFSNAGLTVANGTLGAVASSDGGVTWSATFTPTAGVTDATNVIVLDQTGVSDAAGNAGVGTASSPNYAIDTAAPTAAIVLSDSALSAGESATVTISFSEAVTGLTLADLSAGAGTLSGLGSVDGGVTWTATLTPLAATASAANVITLAANSLADLAGNLNGGATSSANYTVDTMRPSASVTLSDSALKAGETSTVTIAFSEAVSGFSNADLTVANGVLDPVSSADGGVTWTATFTPDAGVTAANNAITLDMTGVADGAGNAGIGAASSANFAIDTARPTATVALNDAALSIGETATVTITFSEAVSGFTSADLAVENGTLGALGSSDGGVTWSATFTPAADVTDATNVITLDNTGISDAAGNAGVGTAGTLNYAIDTAAPTAVIVLSDSALSAGESATVTIAFSEAVTGLTLADLSAGAGTLSGLASADGGVTWTATLTPLAATASAANVITLAANSLTDLAGNPNGGAFSSANYTVDTMPASATVTLSDSALKAGETSVVTIVFSEAVSGFSNADLTVANGALDAVSSADGGITWTATFTPDADVTDATNIIALDNTGVSTAAGNPGVGVTNSANYAIDTARPTATVAISDTALSIGEAATMTITFSEAVSGFTSADLAVANGTLGALGSSDGGVTWSAAFTPADGITDASNIITVDTTAITDAAGNAGADAISSANYAIDTVAPAAAIALSDSALAAGESATVTIAFSEAVTGLTLADLSAGSGILSGLASLDGGVTWTATLTPLAATASAANVITLAANSFTDLAGNPNGGAISSANYTVDTMVPSASVTLSDSALKAGETSVVTIVFSEAVSGFSNADLTVANGVLDAVSSADGGVTWTATFTPDTDVTDATNIIALDNTGVSTAAGNPGVGVTNSANYAIDTARPTATVAISDTALSIGETTTVTITFSEAVSGFTSADLALENGTLGALGSSDGGVTWTAAFTPAVGITDATNAITVDTTGVSDAAGNAGAGTANSANFAIDTAAPTAAIALSDSALAAGESATVTITFSEAVTGLTLADLSAGAGTLDGLASADGGVTWTATLTPLAATASATNVIALSPGAVSDLAGNASAGAASSANYAVDTVLPSATVTLSDNAIKAGETSIVTIVFSQAVSGFSNADLTVANGVLDPVSSADGITWTATFTPDAGITDPTNAITLDSTGVTTAAGNAGLGVTSSANYAIDTDRPTAVIALDDSALKIGDAATVTVTFSEAVSGFTSADLAVANGTLGALSSSDGGVTWTATLTPVAGITDVTNAITVDETGVFDAAGNAGTGAVSSVNYAIDTAAPTAAIALSDSALAAGESAAVTVTFSEAVTGLTLADLSAGSGTLSGLASLDGGVTWTATLTPAGATASAANVISLAASSLTDLAGNPNAGAVSSVNYSVQTVRPTASVTLSDSALTVGETSIVTIAFSEAVGGFSNADLTVANGALAPVSSTDGGVTWHATFTPGAGITAATNAITLDNTGVTNGAGNAGIGATSSANYAIDMVRPSATIALSDRALALGETATVTITFSEAVTGFSNADLAVEHGALGALASSDGGITWRATFTPDAATRASGAIRLATGGVADLAGNAGDTQAVSGTYAIDTWVRIDRREAHIDGAPSTSVTVIDPATGLAMVELTVPVISAFDPAPLLGRPGVADIPLGVAPTELVVRLPIGSGLMAAGPATLLPHAQATTDLISRIDSTTDAGSSEQAEMRAQAHSFLDALATGALVETRTLTLSSGTGFPAGQPIEIIGGAAASADAGAIGLVIDTNALRSDIALQLDSVEFAAIIGAATVRGGAGRNQLIGNHAAQNFSLGDGDDFGAGGGGNDLLAGGAGNDQLLGGTGDDVLQGGRSDRGDWTFLINPAGALVGRHALATFQPGATEDAAAAELNAGAAGLGFVGAKANQLVELALLYDAAFKRAPDLGGLEFYARDFTTAGAVMKSFFGSTEWLAAGNEGLSDTAFLEKMYQQVLHRGPDKPGFAFWLDALAGKDAAPLGRAEFLTAFALSAEHRAMLAGGDGIVVGRGTQAREGDWFAHSGDDRLAGGAGNDVIVGGDGIDTLVYSGKLDDYRFLLGRDGQLRVEDKASGDLDTISGIEKGEFSGGTIGLSFTQADPKTLQSVGLMYQVVLDRAADAGGFAFWVGSHDDSTHMARMFLESAEFVGHYGKLDDAHFVATLLANSAVASTGSVAAGWEAWLGAHSRAELVVALIGDPTVAGVQFGAQGLWLL